MLGKSLKDGLSAVLLALAGSKGYLGVQDVDVLNRLVDAANGVLIEDGVMDLVLCWVSSADAGGLGEIQLFDPQSGVEIF